MRSLTKIDIIFRDLNLLVVNKPCGIPVQSASTQEDLLSKVQNQIGEDYELCNRIDQVVSGLVIFSNDKDQIKLINKALANHEISKEYLAIVHKYEEIALSGTLEGYLFHDKKKRKAFVKDKKQSKAKYAKLDFEKIGELDHYYLLKIRPNQGRFHQIRALLSHANMSIKGDVKYGARRKNSDRCIHLHSYKIEFPESIFGKSQQFIAPLPAEKLWSISKKYL